MFLRHEGIWPIRSLRLQVSGRCRNWSAGGPFVKTPPTPTSVHGCWRCGRHSPVGLLSAGRRHVRRHARRWQHRQHAANEPSGIKIRTTLAADSCSLRQCSSESLDSHGAKSEHAAWPPSSKSARRQPLFADLSLGVDLDAHDCRPPQLGALRLTCLRFRRERRRTLAQSSRWRRGRLDCRSCRQLMRRCSPLSARSSA